MSAVVAFDGGARGEVCTRPVVPSPPNTVRLPEFCRGQAGSFHQRLELGPGDLGINLATPGGGPKATVGAGNHPLSPYHLGVPHNALSHEFRVLNEVGSAIQN